MRSRQYDDDVLAAPSRQPVPPPRVPAETGLVVEDGAADFCGAVVACEKDAVVLEDRFGKRRVFPLSGTFLLEGRRVVLTRPAAAVPAAPGQDRVGVRRRSRRAGPRSRRASRIYVEGKHDAELVEKVWGDDLRDVGVVVEFLNGIDDLPAIAAEFASGSGRRLGVLVDHLVPGSKESRIAAQVTSPGRADRRAPVHRRLGGREAVGGRPDRLAGRAARACPGRKACWPRSAGRRTRPPAWRRILSRVQSYADLEPAFLGRVEELIDFVTEPGTL